MEIGEKVKKLRELKNFTQEYMAQSLDMTPSGYGKIERNETEVSYTKLDKIAQTLGIKVEDIISFNEKLVFNIMHNQQGNGYVVNNQSTTDNERKLFEQIIAQQREEIEYLRNLVSTLKG